MNKLVLLIGLLMSNLGASQTITVNPERTIRVVGEVDGSMLQVIQDLDRLSARSSEPIFLLINSPGGSILVGNLVINAMNTAKARGVKLHCASTLLAASMAFQFFVECDYRYAMKHTKLLFHPPRIFYMGILLEQQMRSWIRELNHIESKMVPRIQAELGFETKKFDFHYHEETLWDAEDLAMEADGFLQLIDNIGGLANIYQYAPANRNYANGQLIWIASAELGGN